jgi:hypothetical protein
MDPILVGDPLIQHDVVTNCKECFDGGCLPGAHSLDKYNQVADDFLLQDVSIGGN